MGAFIGYGDIGVWVSNRERNAFLDWFAKNRCSPGGRGWEYCTSETCRVVDSNVELSVLVPSGQPLRLTEEAYSEATSAYWPHVAQLLGIVDTITRGEWLIHANSTAATAWRRPIAERPDLWETSRENLENPAYLQYASIAAQFPRLEPDSPSSCPIDLRTIGRFKELPPGDTLRFLRTACVMERDYWLWEAYTEIDTEDCPAFDEYVAVSRSPGRPIRITYHEKRGLTPEQFALADYHRDVFPLMPQRWFVQQVSIDDVPVGCLSPNSGDLRGEMLPGDEVWEFSYNEGFLYAGHGFVLVRNGKPIDRMFTIIS